MLKNDFDIEIQNQFFLLHHILIITKIKNLKVIMNRNLILFFKKKNFFKLNLIFEFIYNFFLYFVILLYFLYFVFRYLYTIINAIFLLMKKM